MSPTRIMSYLLHRWSTLLVITSLFLLSYSPECSLANHTDVEVLPSLSLDTIGSEVTVSDQANYNVTCSSPKNTMTTLMWRRVVNSAETPVTDGITDTSTNVTTNLMLTITSNSLMEGDTIEYFCTAMNNVGTARTRSLRVRRAFFGGFSTSPGVSNITVRLTHAVAMDCGVLPSSPRPAITWRMNGVAITEILFPDLKYRFLDDGQYLVIYNLVSADVNAGMVPVNYTCEVTNVNASLTEVSPITYNLIEVAMFDPPGFMAYRPPQNVIVSDLMDSYIVYYIGATNEVDIGQLNLNEFPGGDESSRNLSLTYSGSVLAGVTDLQCVISLQNGGDTIIESRKAANITVLDPLVVQSAVPSGIIREFTGQPLSFNCTATGTGVQFAWYRNGATLTTSSATTHVISSASPDDNGVYQCHWYSQQLGTFETHTWGLIITNPVRPLLSFYQSSPVETESNKTIVMDGMPVTLQLEVRADTLPTITWRVNGTAISVNDSNYEIGSIIEEERGDDHFYMSNLTILMVNDATIGNYSAMIDDTRTEPITTPAQLVSYPLPPTLVSLTSSLGCLLDSTEVRLTCVANGLPTPVVTFWKGLNPLPCDPGSSCNISENILIFTRPSSTDDGRYSCLAINSLVGTAEEGQLRSPVRELNYCTQPAISNFTSQVTFMFGQSIGSLNCIVSGQPAEDLMVNWTFGTQTLRDSDKYTVVPGNDAGNHRLIINNVNSDDAGTYRCTVSHRLLPNTETRSVAVTVTGEPTTNLPVWSFPLMALGGVVVILLLIAVVFLAVLCCCYSDKRGGYTPGGKATEATDGRGNVDQDSDEEAQREEPEEFRPQYESLPALRPAMPPQYKPSPAYNQQFAMPGDDMEMVKVPPPETDSTAFEFQPYPHQDNGSVVGSAVGGDGYPAQQARFDDFMSDDGQFV